MDTISFKRHRFPPEIIRRAVWLYARFTLSYRDVENLLAERGLDISYESVRRWFLKFGAPIARNLYPIRITILSCLLDPPDLHEGVADQINMVSRLVSFADSHRA